MTTCLLAGLILASNRAYAQESAQASPPHSKTLITQTLENNAYEKLLGQAENLIRKGNAAVAYALLEPLEFEHSGEERFDYLLGTAALDSGKPDKATLAFERILMINPYSAAARMEMARAYYQLGDMPRAKAEFETVLKFNVSVEVNSIIQKYLDDIVQQESGKLSFMSGYLEVMTGSDSNVNNSINQSQIFVDAVTAYINLDPTSIKTGDQYTGLAAGGKISHRLGPTFGMYAAADIKQRNYFLQKSFNTLTMDARAGMTLKMKTEHLQLSALGGQYSLGGAHYSDAAGFKGEWLHEFSPSNQLNLFTQQTRYTFADVAMQTNNFMQQVNSAGWIHVYADGKSTISGNFYLGTEQDISTIVTSYTPTGGRIDGSKNFNGVRVNWQSAITDKTSLSLGVGQQTGNYSKTNPLFLRQRNDRLFDLTASADWRWDKLWTLRSQLYYSKNASNIGIYSYDKLDISLIVRRNFR
ncbi:MAG: tetratricopeptide repeat protein [Gallionellaceae bacterium]